ncbi:DHA2 family efflux MFS transporter permease subunit [Nguyenibacter vanlangensis]|uniref:DHA2 family efflux MFS transporter permease subunit n=1 Tax=Nguyenibacter vanlangensis TaxID=1216886 RepID=A0ABZ3D4L5_9PROT
MSEGTNAASGSWRPSANPWLIAVTVTLAAFMEILDGTIINVALPHISGALGSSYDDATWALTSYLVANGIVLTISAWFGKVLGRKRYFMICIAMFTVCSFMCGLSTSLPMLIVFRLMQGFFGGGLQPNQQSIILDTFPPDKRGAAFGLTAIATIVGPIMGPLLGGYLVDNFSWRWIFYVNVPFGILTMIGVALLVEDPPWERPARQPVDVIGIALISLGLGGLEIMCDRGEDEDWFGSSFVTAMAVCGVAGTIGAVVWLRRARHPLVNLDIFKDRNFAAGTFLMGMMGAVLYASAVIVPQFAQQVLGYTATLSGLLLAPGGTVVILMIPVIGRMMGVVQVRAIIATGFLVMGASMFASARLTPDIDFSHLVLFRIFQTASLGFLFVPISTAAYSTLPRELNADGSAIFSMARNYVGSLSISLATATVIQAQQRQQAYLVDRMSPYRPEYQHYLAVAKQAALDAGMSPANASQYAPYRLYRTFMSQVSLLAYNEVFMMIGLLAFSVVPLCFFLSPDRKRRSAAPASIH